MNCDDQILAALRQVNDPELGISIVDLGLVERVETGENSVSIALLMTSPTCPFSEQLGERAQQAVLAAIPELGSVEVEILRDPPWHPGRMSDAARKQFGL